MKYGQPLQLSHSVALFVKRSFRLVLLVLLGVVWSGFAYLDSFVVVGAIVSGKVFW